MANLEQVMEFYNNDTYSHLYLDKHIDMRGISYKSFIKLKYESINNQYIKDIYTVDGWYILFFLMSNGLKCEYIYTSISSISELTNISLPRVREALKHLYEKSIIYTPEIVYDLKSVKNNDHLHIAIGYNNNNSPYEKQEGYRPIPTEFIKRILPKITPAEWSIFCVMCTWYNYFQVIEKVNKDTGEINYCYFREHYSYPTMDRLVDILGLCKDTVFKSINNLESKKYIKVNTLPKTFTENKDGKRVVAGGNNRYYIPILERPEYFYHYIYMEKEKLDDEQKKQWKYIAVKGFENIAKSSEQHILRTKNVFYVYEYFLSYMEKYSKIYKERSMEEYGYFRNNYLSEFKVR